jgi:3'-phosphoadenosine 5'-phosphosulfate sulfotransferase (PAPS reductase)/FAD synthetase
MARRLPQKKLDTARVVFEAIAALLPPGDLDQALPLADFLRAIGAGDDPTEAWEAVKHLASVGAISLGFDQESPIIRGSDLPAGSDQDIVRSVWRTTGMIPGPELQPPLKRKIEDRRWMPIGLIRLAQDRDSPISQPTGCDRFGQDDWFVRTSEHYPDLTHPLDLTDYDIIAINISGGKDSQAMLDAVCREACKQGVLDRVIVFHADLREVEWPGNTDLVILHARYYGVPLRIVSHDKTLLDRVLERGEWPSQRTMYCTAEFKRGQVNKAFTREVDHLLQQIKRPAPIRVLNCIGVRAEESPKRAKMAPFVSWENDATYGSNNKRHVDKWMPTFQWSRSQVWNVIRRSQVPFHWSYTVGMPRLSCAFCIMGNRDALLLSGSYNPDLLDRYVEVERTLRDMPGTVCSYQWEKRRGCVFTKAARAAHKALLEAGEAAAPLPAFIEAESCGEGMEPADVCVPTQAAIDRDHRAGKPTPKPKLARARQWRFKSPTESWAGTIEEIREAIERGETPKGTPEVDSEM